MLFIFVYKEFYLSIGQLPDTSKTNLKCTVNQSASSDFGTLHQSQNYGSDANTLPKYCLTLGHHILLKCKMNSELENLQAFSGT